ncbi:MAG: hypothetical protein CVU39_20245 [Chloroflexi bacterium HGW-Chloroflexi-10]|nr:MAG: hypothetical protein CVU39_20245 [Chloroflexi bacterium HGW-Chloroflexi-10]
MVESQIYFRYFKIIILLWVLLLLAGCTTDKVLTVSEVWEQADALEGTTILARGRMRLFTSPYQGLTGCVQGGGNALVGIAALYDEDAEDPHYSEEPLNNILIAESDLRCVGNTCGMTCVPFDPKGGMIFELMGTLRVEREGGLKNVLLEDIQLEKSFRIIEEKREPIPTGKFEYLFP